MKLLALSGWLVAAALLIRSSREQRAEVMSEASPEWYRFSRKGWAGNDWDSWRDLERPEFV